jgi:hypothetical protein
MSRICLFFVSSQNCGQMTTTPCRSSLHAAKPSQMSYNTKIYVSLTPSQNVCKTPLFRMPHISCFQDAIVLTFPADKKGPESCAHPNGHRPHGAHRTHGLHGLLEPQSPNPNSFTVFNRKFKMESMAFFRVHSLWSSRHLSNNILSRCCQKTKLNLIPGGASAPPDPPISRPGGLRNS